MVAGSKARSLRKSSNLCAAQTPGTTTSIAISMIFKGRLPSRARDPRTLALIVLGSYARKQEVNLTIEPDEWVGAHLAAAASQSFVMTGVSCKPAFVGRVAK